ncbi:MAG: phosphoribosylamine--glycine ligase [Gammaproteobacteria bacterium]|nr:phosphoribosylamine--glycine ligase [Gammaproteobacteria bacterium]
MKNILVVGSGGREHALAWKFAQSPNTHKVYVAPGNAGTALEDGIENINISSDDINSLLTFAKDSNIDLTVVGPEAPLVAGIVDQFKSAGLTIFGPKQFNAQLEGSKSFAKQFMHHCNIPTANYKEFTDVSQAITYLSNQSFPIVIKADGLAAGKGVVIAQDNNEAVTTVESMLTGNAHGEAGKKIVIEEFIEGEEVSFICLVDHDTVIPLASSQDHKARDNGDLGPNTGGMGAYSPAPLVTEELHSKIISDVIRPTVQGFIDEGHPYQGFLYAGLMITAQGEPKVLEFNCRFGDPETQPILMRLQSDLFELCWDAARNQLKETNLRWNPQTALGVVMAAGGYPFSYEKGESISGIENVNTQHTKVFHAGTTLKGSSITTSGGRVLCVTSLGDDIKSAQQNAYQDVKSINWKDVYYRDDIGFKAIK